MHGYTIALATALALASGASGATLTLDTDKATYTPGELITITAILTTDGTEPPDSPFGTAVELSVSWDPTSAFVANGSLPGNYGFSTQIITAGPNAGAPGIEGSSLSSSGGSDDWIGPSTSSCVTAGPGAGNRCILVNQSEFLGLGPDAQTLVSTLVLQADLAVGPLGLAITAAQFFGGGIGDVNLGANFAAATVPEPTTGATLCLGLVGLGLSRRRRLRAHRG